MIKKFLIGQLACYGDCLYATSIAKQIKHDFPDSHITWAISGKYKSILINNPDVDEIWEVNPPGNDFYRQGWSDFQDEAIRRKNQGIYDEVIFSQISPRNWFRYNQTIRKAILESYSQVYTVSLAPVIRLSATEVENVQRFVKTNGLGNFKSAILFECAPGSGQSNVNINFALEIAENVVRDDKTVCFVLSSNIQIENIHPQIFDASGLSYRENAELVKHCNFLIGCSSGITWISTSDWAKPLPMLQLLNNKSEYFASVDFDFKMNKMDNSQVIEMVEFSKSEVEECIKAMLNQPISDVKKKFHQVCEPGSIQLSSVVKKLIETGHSLEKVLKYHDDFVRLNSSDNNKIKYSRSEIYYEYFKFKFYMVKYKYLRSVNGIASLTSF